MLVLTLRCSAQKCRIFARGVFVVGFVGCVFVGVVAIVCFWFCCQDFGVMV